MSEKSKSICLPNIAMVIGFIFLVIGLVFAAIFFFKGKIFVGVEATFGFGFMSLGFAMYALAFSIKSDQKMKSLSNVQFLNVVNMLEDARIEFNKTLTYLDSLINPNKYSSPVYPGYSAELFTWKTLTCVEMAVELIKKDEGENYISHHFKKKLFYYFNMSFKHLFKLSPVIWKNEKASLKHLIDSYAFLDDYYIEPYKTELKNYIEGEKEDYFKNFFKEVGKFKESDNFKNRIALT